MAQWVKVLPITPEILFGDSHGGRRDLIPKLYSGVEQA